MYEYKRISPTVYVLNASPEEKYYFESKKKARQKWKAMGNPAYKASVKAYCFDTKQELLDFVTGQNQGDKNEYQSVTRNNL